MKKKSTAVSSLFALWDKASKAKKVKRRATVQPYSPALIVEHDEQKQVDLEGLEHDLGKRISIPRYDVNDQDSKELLEQLL